MSISSVLAVGDGQLERIVARGRLATVTDHRHDPRAGRHRDPSEESFDGPSLVFSEGEPWRFRSTAGAIDVDPRGVLLVEAGTPYQARHERSFPADRSLTIRFHAEAVRGLAGPATSPPFFATWWLPRSTALEAARLRVARAASRADGETLDGAALALLDLVGSADLVGSDAASADAPDGRDRVVDGAAWLRANMADGFSLADLARATHTSPFHLSRLFRRHLGMPPFAYLRGIRLERAAELLRDGDEPVTVVCYAVGFESLSHFVTAFRTTYGVSPGAYRRRRGADRPRGAPTARRI